MEELINVLNKIWDDEKCFGEDTAFSYENADVNEACGIASDLLITDDGRPNIKNIKELARISDYRVNPGEQDSFGWLTGAITRKGSNRTLYFG